ncbi:MAG: DMT family transporter, partial [Lachnospiraceae bacterium]|nr:DMT family transporter [Lachnospiraceae bacterium]
NAAFYISNRCCNYYGSILQSTTRCKTVFMHVYQHRWNSISIHPGGQTSIKGILLAALSGVTYAFYIVLLGKSRLGELHPLVLSFWIACFSAIEIGTIGCLIKSIRFDMDATAWMAEVILAVLTTVIALVLFQRGVYLCGEIKASLLSSFEPVTGILVGVVVFYEKISWNEMVGIISIIIAAIVLVVPFKKKKVK